MVQIYIVDARLSYGRWQQFRPGRCSRGCLSPRASIDILSNMTSARSWNDNEIAKPKRKVAGCKNFVWKLADRLTHVKMVDDKGQLYSAWPPNHEVTNTSLRSINFIAFRGQIWTTSCRNSPSQDRPCLRPNSRMAPSRYFGGTIPSPKIKLTCWQMCCP